MFDFQYNKPIAIINGLEYEVYFFEKTAINSVTMMVRNKEYNWVTSAVENETIINGILQTSSDMIIETLSNGQS